MANAPVRIRITGDVKDFVSNIGTAKKEMTDFGDTADKEVGSVSDRLVEGGDQFATYGAMAAGGIAGIGPVVDKVIPGFGDLSTKISGTMQFAADMGDTVVSAVEGGGKAINKVKGLYDQFNGKFKALSIVTKIQTGAQAALNLVMSANPIALVVLAIAALVAGFVIAYKKSETFRDIVNGAMGMVKTAVGWVLDAVGKVPAAFSNISSVFPTIKNAFKDFINTIIGWWNSLDFSVNFNGWGPIPSIHTGDLIPDIPKLARGGIVVAGDNPSGIEAIVPLERAGEMGFGGGGSGATINLALNFNGLVAGDPRRIGQQIAEYLSQYFGAGGSATRFSPLGVAL